MPGSSSRLLRGRPIGAIARRQSRTGRATKRLLVGQGGFRRPKVGAPNVRALGRRR